MRQILVPLSLLALTPFARTDETKPAAEAQAKDGAIVWITDFEAAKAEAAKSGRDILVDFTGSDWCGWCIKLKQEVFDQQAFAPAAKHFVFLELDFPNKKQLPESLKKQNKALAEKFSVQGYPTVLLLDAQGVPYASTGYEAGGPENYLKNLALLRSSKIERSARVEAAGKLSGDARAKELADIARTVDPSIRKFQADLMAKLAAADPDDKQGIRIEEEIDALPGLARAEYARSQDTAAALKVFDAFLAAHPTLPAGTRQKAGAERFNLFAFHLRKTVPDKAAMTTRLLAEVDRLVALSPQSDIAKQMIAIRPRIEAMAKDKTSTDR